MNAENGGGIAAIPKWKLVLACVGVLYLIGFLGWGVYAFTTSEKQQGASELAANPDRQQEILAKRRAEEAGKQLGLSEEQTTTLAKLIESHTAEARALRDAQTDDMEAQRNKITALREKFLKEVNTLLTPEQREKLEAMPMRDRARLFGRGPFGGPPEGMGQRGPRPEGGPGWGEGPRGPRPEGGPGWGDGPRGPRPEGRPGWGEGPRGPRPEGRPGPRGEQNGSQSEGRPERPRDDVAPAQ